MLDSKATEVYSFIMNILWCIIIYNAIVSGTVKSKATGSPLETVHIQLQNTHYGCISAQNGHYVLPNIPSGEYKIVFSMIGYKSYSRELKLEDSVLLNVELEEEIIEMPGIEVRAEREEFKEELKVSSLKLGMRELKNTPAFIEGDILRVIQKLPGVVTQSDFSTAFYVRGGNSDENLILLEDVSIFNPFHLGGVVSTFDIDVIKSAELLAGGFSSEYGERLSSVLDIRMREGRGDPAGRPTLSTSISPLSAKALIEGPLMGGSFLLSGRRTYFDKLLPLFDYEFPYYFWDAFGKLSFDPSKNTKIYFSAFRNNDVFDFDKIYAQWGNSIATIGMTHIINPVPSRLGGTLLYTTSLSFSKFGYNFDMVSAFIESANSVEEYTLKHKLSSLKAGSHKLEGGIEIKYTTYRYDNYLQGLMNFQIKGVPLYSALYLQDKITGAIPPWRDEPDSGNKFILEPGIRFDYYHTLENPVSEKTTFLNPAPRLRAKYFLTKDIALKGSAGRFYQFSTAILPEETSIPFIYPWVPVFGKYPPESATHYILGIESFVREDLNLSIESYYKSMDKLLLVNMEMDPKTFFDSLFLVGHGNSYGIDCLLKKLYGNPSGWISYSLAYTKAFFNGQEYYPLYDRRHNLNIVGIFKLGRGFDFSVSFNYASGLPYTGATGRMLRRSWSPITNWTRYRWIDIPGEKNALRYPLYHRMDIGLTKGIKKWGVDFIFNFQIINLYNHKNVFMYYYDYDTEPPIRETIYMFPFLPSLEVKTTF